MNDLGPKMSIITATFNSKQFLGDTIRSVLGQNYKNIQYIVIDGGSTDGTLDVLQQFHQGIDVLVSEPDEGVYDAFNKGISYATGEIIYFLNSDDYLIDDGVLQTVVTAFNEHPGAMGVYGKIIYRQEDMDLWEPFHSGPIGVEELQRGLLPPHPAFFARHELYKKIGKFDLSYKIAADTDFMQRCFREDPRRFCFIDKWIAVHRRGGVSTNLKGYDLVRQEHSAILEKYLGIVVPQSTEEVKLNSYYRKWIEKLLFGHGGISKCLQVHGIGRIVIIGANRMGLYLYQDAYLLGITTVALLDNNPPLIGQRMRGVPVYPISWLEKNLMSIDAVLVAFDGTKEHPDFQKLAVQIKNSGRYYFTWREIIEMSENS